MTIFAFASLKGGAGKTTLSLHLASEIAASGRKVLVLDADPQASASDWAASRDENDPASFDVVAMARKTVHRDLPSLAAGYDHVVIDTPPRVSNLARSCIIAADVVIIPVQPSSFDVWASSETVEIIEEARDTVKPDLVAAFAVNRVVAASSLTNDIKEALAAQSIPALKSTIGQRVSFSRAAAGYAVREFEPRSAAAKEIVAISQEIKQLAGLEEW